MSNDKQNKFQQMAEGRFAQKEKNRTDKDASLRKYFKEIKRSQKEIENEIFRDRHFYE
jgi:hypothetical protein